MGRIKNKMATKTIYRLAKPDNYVIISRHLLEDARLSYEARGLLACMLAKPNDWIFYISFFIKNGPAGRDKVHRIFKELIGYGYIVRQKHRNEKGHFSSPEYTVYESPVRENQPHPEKPFTVNPYPDKPSTENLPLLNKHLRLNKQDTKNTTTNRDDYIWATQLSGLHKASIYSLLTDVDNKEDIQLLLDELSGQIDNIKNPVGYFRTLLKSYLLGEFTPAKALQIQSSRKQKIENELALERSRQYHEEQLNQQIRNYQEN